MHGPVPNFTIRDISAGRFEGEFAIETAPAHSVSDSEKKYLTKLDEIHTKLAENKRQDETDFLRPQLEDARRRHRKHVAAALRQIALGFVSGTINADNAWRETAAADAQNYPDVVAQDKTPTRFRGDFFIREQNYSPDPEERMFFDRIDEVLKKLSDDEADDKTARYSETRLHGRQECREEAAIALRKQFEEFRKSAVIATKAADNALVIQGIYFAKRDRLKLPLFQVKLDYDEKSTRAVNLIMALNNGLPPPDDQPSQEKQDLFVQVNQSWTVIETVCKHMRERAKNLENRRWPISLFFKKRRLRRAALERERADLLEDQYLKKLYMVALNGLEEPWSALSNLALKELRAQFTLQEAGRIKNIYLRSLGAAAALTAASLLFLYALITNFGRGWCGGWCYDHKSFLVAAAGAAIGSWLSFSIRRVTLSFEELGVLEEDLLDPSVRVAFVIGLTVTACLLFWTGVMNIQVGDLKTNATEFMQKGSIAMLLGILFGISERVLATAISGRATAFVRGIGSG